MVVINRAVMNGFGNECLADFAISRFRKPTNNSFKGCFNGSFGDQCLNSP